MYFFNLWESGLLERSHNEIAQSAKRIFANEPVLNALLDVYGDADKKTQAAENCD